MGQCAHTMRAGDGKTAKVYCCDCGIEIVKTKHGDWKPKYTRAERLAVAK